MLVRDRNEQLASIKERHSDELSHMMQEMRTLRVNYEEKITEYEDLLDLRVKLEQEIQTLSALLQEEESRCVTMGTIIVILLAYIAQGNMLLATC